MPYRNPDRVRRGPRKPLPPDHPLTSTQARLLLHLYMEGGKLPHQLYPVICPKGRFNTDTDTGSTKGGPSRMEYAVNNYMGRLDARGWVRRYGYLDKLAPAGLAGKWVLTAKGNEQVESAHLLAVASLLPKSKPRSKPPSKPAS